MRIEVFLRNGRFVFWDVVGFRWVLVNAHFLSFSYVSVFKFGIEQWKI